MILTLVLPKFCFREGKEEYVPFDFGPYCSASSFDAASPIFHDIVPALESLNIEVEQVTNNSKILHSDQSVLCVLTCIYFVIVSC